MSVPVTDAEYIAELKLLFKTKGWKLFLTELEANYRALDTLDGISSLEVLWKNQGQRLVLANILNLENILASNEALEDEDDTPKGPSIH